MPLDSAQKPHASRRIEYRNIGLALFFYILAAMHPFLLPALPSLPDKFLFNVCFGLAIVFQTEVIVQWQQAGKTAFEEPRHGIVFLLTAFGGGGLIYGALVLPDYFMAAIIVLATGSTATLYARSFAGNALSASSDPDYRDAQLQAREHALRAMVVGASVFILLSTAELVTPPLWLSMALILWLGAVAATGWMWCHRKGASIREKRNPFSVGKRKV